MATALAQRLESIWGCTSAALLCWTGEPTDGVAPCRNGSLLRGDLAAPASSPGRWIGAEAVDCRCCGWPMRSCLLVLDRSRRDLAIRLAAGARHPAAHLLVRTQAVAVAHCCRRAASCTARSLASCCSLRAASRTPERSALVHRGCVRLLSPSPAPSSWRASRCRHGWLGAQGFAVWRRAVCTAILLPFLLSWLIRADRLRLVLSRMARSLLLGAVCAGRRNDDRGFPLLLVLPTVLWSAFRLTPQPSLLGLC